MHPHLREAIAQAHADELVRRAARRRIDGDRVPVRDSLFGRLKPAPRSVSPRPARAAVVRADRG